MLPTILERSVAVASLVRALFSNNTNGHGLLNCKFTDIIIHCTRAFPPVLRDRWESDSIMHGGQYDDGSAEKLLDSLRLLTFIDTWCISASEIAHTPIRIHVMEITPWPGTCALAVNDTHNFAWRYDTLFASNTRDDARALFFLLYFLFFF